MSRMAATNLRRTQVCYRCRHCIFHSTLVFPQEAQEGNDNKIRYNNSYTYGLLPDLDCRKPESYCVVERGVGNMSRVAATQNRSPQDCLRCQNGYLCIICVCVSSPPDGPIDSMHGVPLYREPCFMLSPRQSPVYLEPQAGGGGELYCFAPNKGLAT